MKRFLKLCLAAAVWSAVAIPPPALAYNLQPIVVQLSPAGAGSSQMLTLTNTHEVPIAIEVKAYRREQQPDGTDRLVPEEEDLIIYPPQMVIPAQQSQTFKVQWVGEPNPERELAYRIVTEQLPIKFESQEVDGRKADLTMRYRYEAALYIMPNGATPLAELVSATSVAAEDGTRMLELHIASKGTMRAILDDPTLVLSPASGAPITLSGDDTKPLVGLNILPGVERVVRIPAPSGIGDGPVPAQLQASYIELR
ncbi:molecular chaperone [Pelagerythrobacter sp.]|uniref:fimbrial biogenesis chaperone n=1 Tax=Pelagerythrobacter sp. TaxID=2800702 RepID=UPI0035B1369D